MAIKIDWVRVLRQSRMGKGLSLGFTAKARPGISPDAPLCTRCGAHMLKRTGSFGPFWGCGQFPRCRATQRKDRGATRAGPVTESPGPLQARDRQGGRRNRGPPRYPASARRFGCGPASTESPPESRPRRPRPPPAWRFGAGAHREYDSDRAEFALSIGHYERQQREHAGRGKGGSDAPNATGTDGRERARLRFESVLARARRSVTETILLTSTAKPGIMHTSGAGSRACAGSGRSGPDLGPRWAHKLRWSRRP